jgi:hypothetical protein
MWFILEKVVLLQVGNWRASSDWIPPGIPVFKEYRQLFGGTILTRADGSRAFVAVVVDFDGRVFREPSVLEVDQFFFGFEVCLDQNFCLGIHVLVSGLFFVQAFGGECAVVDVGDHGFEKFFEIVLFTALDAGLLFENFNTALALFVVGFDAVFPHPVDLFVDLFPGCGDFLEDGIEIDPVAVHPRFVDGGGIFRQVVGFDIREIKESGIRQMDPSFGR